MLASGFSSRGLCADVVRHVLAKHELVIGEVVLKELLRVLADKFSLPKPLIEEIEVLLRRQEVVPTPRTLPKLALRDPDDLAVLASALAANVDVVVTGDGDLLALRGKVDVAITDPRGFWESLKQRKQ